MLFLALLASSHTNVAVQLPSPPLARIAMMMAQYEERWKDDIKDPLSLSRLSPNSFHESLAPSDLPGNLFMSDSDSGPDIDLNIGVEAGDILEPGISRRTTERPTADCFKHRNSCEVCVQGKNEPPDGNGRTDWVTSWCPLPDVC
ncbi:hypothetical protein C8R47DRAFT_336828 [Mycena vitilis]|nr:hypothetical protein C8R47DRAFT_336828 [Mycena vitilis]